MYFAYPGLAFTLNQPGLGRLTGWPPPERPYPHPSHGRPYPGAGTCSWDQDDSRRRRSSQTRRPPSRRHRAHRCWFVWVRRGNQREANSRGRAVSVRLFTSSQRDVRPDSGSARDIEVNSLSASNGLPAASGQDCRVALALPQIHHDSSTLQPFPCSDVSSTTLNDGGERCSP